MLIQRVYGDYCTNDFHRKYFRELKPCLSADGRQLYIPAGKQLEVISLEETEKGLVSRRKCKIDTPDEIHAIAIGPSGLLYIAVEEGAQSQISVLRRDNLVLFAELPESPQHMVVTDRYVAVVFDAKLGASSRMLTLDRRTGRVTNEMPLTGEISRIRASGNDRIVIIDSLSKTVRRLSLSEICRPNRNDPKPTPRDSDPDEHRGTDCPPPPPNRDSGRREDPRLPHRPPADYCRPGDDGIDEDCWFTVTVGDHVIRVNLCDPAAEDCQRTLFSRVEQIEKVGNRILAVVEHGRAVIELEPTTLAVINRQHLRTPVSTLLAAGRSGTALALGAGGEIIAHVSLPADTQAASSLSIAAEISEKIVEGTRFSLPDPKPQFAVTPLNVLLVPMRESGQNYSENSLSAYDDVMRNSATLGTDAPLAVIQRYYVEQSNQQQSVNVDIFGATTPDFYDGAPISLPSQFQSYYFPNFEPGGIVMTPALGALPAEYRFTGAERHTISVISAINITATDFNATELELVFPAGILSFNLGSGLTVEIDTAGPPAQFSYLDRDGNTQNLVLDPSVLGADQEIEFDSSMDDFGPSIESLRSALQTIMDSADTTNDFASVGVRWVKTDGTLGQINMLLSFANGSGPERPRINNFDGGATLESFFGLDSDSVSRLPGFGLFDPSHPDGINWLSSRIESYFERVMLLAEAAASETGYVPERLLGSAEVDAQDNAGNLNLTVQLNLSLQHGGGGVATILAGNGVGEDVIEFDQGQSIIGSTHTYDQRNTLMDKEAFYEEVYGSMIAAIDNHTGGLSTEGWVEMVEDLSSYDTIFAMPIAPPPSGSSGLWSVAEANDTDRLRASVNSGLTISDPNGLAEGSPTRWGVQFMNFDSRLGGNTRTLAHEFGHSLNLSDQYFSSKFHPALKYLGGLDLMGSSSADWPHFCAYHKLAVGWYGEADRIVIDQPAADTTTTRRFILGPVEWWDPNLQSEFEDAFPSEPSSTEATGAVVCDLGGDGGVIALIEARSQGAEFSGDLGSSTQLGRVMVTNVLDYGTNGRYGQVLPDLGELPDDVIKGFLRYRRRIHAVETNMQAGDPVFDMATAPAFPVAGLEIEVIDEASVSLQGTDATGSTINRAVPVYLCELNWSLGPNADVGFSDNEQEWRSSDIGIDWVGSGGDESGTTNWPVGQPSGVGDTVRIPGSGEEPHEVMVRVWNFGNTTAHNVEVELYLRNPGGGGDPNKHNLYDTVTIDELPPEAESGPVERRFPWNVPEGQEPHICWRAEIAGFELGEGVAANPVVNDALVANNWAQQNIFEADVVYSSPPEPIETRFSVHNDGAFIEHAYLEPRGMPKGVTMKIRPRLLRVPAFTTRYFHIRLEFDEEIIDDACRREMEILVQCWRHEDHSVELWGSSLFKLKVREKTTTKVEGFWLSGLHVNTLSLNGIVAPGFVLGEVALRLDFQNGEPAMWVDTPLSVGGLFDEVIDTTGINHNNVVVVTATYRGSPLHAVSTSDPTSIYALQPAG